MAGGPNQMEKLRRAQSEAEGAASIGSSIPRVKRDHIRWIAEPRASDRHPNGQINVARTDMR